ncbi:MAG: M20 family peptidase [Balneolales bacterium]
MHPKRKVLIFLAVPVTAIVLLATVLIYRTVSITNVPPYHEDVILDDIDHNQAIARLSRAIQFPTVSYQDHDSIDYRVFRDFISFIEREFPLVHEHLEQERFGDYSLLYTWQGSSPNLDPVMMIGHYDVVPVDDHTLDNWQYEPFSGELADGYIWGKGAIDDKSGILSNLEAAEYLLESGYRPERTILIGLNHDEEIGGRGGARVMADSLYTRGITLHFLIDEGLPVAEKIFSGITSPLAMIGVAEKGYVSLELSLTQEGGHSSMPPRETVIGIMSRAINDLNDNPMPGRFSGLIQESFIPVSPELPFTYRMALANLWLFRGLVESRLSDIPHTNAALRTTAAPTFFQSGIKENVLPTHAEAIVNFRIHPADNVISVKEHVYKTINNSEIVVKEIEGARNPSFISETNNKPYLTVKKTIHDVFPGVPVAPSMFIAASDSRHFHDITRNIYRFRPIRAKPEDRSRVHGTNERISADNYREMILFQIQLIKNSSSF